MSIRPGIIEAARALRERFEFSHLYPGARIAERIRAEQKDYEVRLRDLRELESTEGESYAQATARLTGAEPTAFEAADESARDLAAADARRADVTAYFRGVANGQLRDAGHDEMVAEFYQEAPLGETAELPASAAGPVAEPEPSRAVAEAALAAEEQRTADYWGGTGPDFEAAAHASDLERSRPVADITADRNAGTISADQYREEMRLRESMLAEDAWWAEVDAAPKLTTGGTRPVAEIYADYNAGRSTYAQVEHELDDREDEIGSGALLEETTAAPALELTEADANRIEPVLEEAREEPETGDDAFQYAPGEADDDPEWVDPEDGGLPGYDGAQTVEEAAAFAGIDPAELEREPAEEAAESAPGHLALHDGHQAAWHKVGDLRREPVDSSAYQAREAGQ